MKRDMVLPIIGLMLGTALLAFQFGLTIPARIATGASPLASIVFFFSFFTILSNIGVVLSYLSVLTRWSWLRWFRRHKTRTLLAALILIVMLVYHFLLANIWTPAGLFKLADVGLHYATPVLYLLWWVTMPRIETLNFNNITMMMVPPLFYLVYILSRGHLTGLYPYPFIDAGLLGYIRTLLNCAAIFTVTAAIIVVFIAIDRRLFNLSQK